MCRELHTTIYISPRETCVENYIQLFISTQERHVKRTTYNYLYLPKRDMCRELHTTIYIYPRETCVENYIQLLISTQERHVQRTTHNY